MRLKKETFTRQINEDQLEKQKQKMVQRYQTEQEKEMAKKLMEYNS